MENIEYYIARCVKENFIGRGFIRKAYKVDDMAVKMNFHQLGYLQSKKESRIFRNMVERDYQKYFAEVFYCDADVSIRKYYPNLFLINRQS